MLKINVAQALREAEIAHRTARFHELRDEQRALRAMQNESGTDFAKERIAELCTLLQKEIVAIHRLQTAEPIIF